jgi:hypothetical protein
LAWDAAGNASACTHLAAFTHDDQAPNLTVASPTESQGVSGGFACSKTISVSGDCEALSGDVSMTYGAGASGANSATCASDNTYTLSVTYSGGMGLKSITASQTDAAGNLASVTRTISLTCGPISP